MLLNKNFCNYYEESFYCPSLSLPLFRLIIIIFLPWNKTLLINFLFSQFSLVTFRYIYMCVIYQWTIIGRRVHQSVWEAINWFFSVLSLSAAASTAHTNSISKWIMAKCDLIKCEKNLARIVGIPQIITHRTVTLNYVILLD